MPREHRLQRAARERQAQASPITLGASIGALGPDRWRAFMAEALARGQAIEEAIREARRGDRDRFARRDDLGEYLASVQGPRREHEELIRELRALTARLADLSEALSGEARWLERRDRPHASMPPPAPKAVEGGLDIR